MTKLPVSDRVVRAVITGGRDHIPTGPELRECARVLREHKVVEVSHGACRGVDVTAGWWLKTLGFTIAEHPADWARHGKGAGPARNRAMLDQPGVVVLVAFPGGAGTWGCVREARSRRIAVHVIERKLPDPSATR